jgi:hypothetical protein
MAREEIVLLHCGTCPDRDRLHPDIEISGPSHQAGTVQRDDFAFKSPDGAHAVYSSRRFSEETRDDVIFTPESQA